MKNFIFCSLFILALCVAQIAHADISKFTDEMAILEANYVKSEDAFDKLLILNSEEIPEEMPPAIGKNIEEFWFTSANESCSATFKKKIEEGLDRTNYKDEKSFKKFQDEMSKAASDCRMKYYHDNYKKISKMIALKYEEMQCLKKSWYDPAVAICWFRGYRIKQE